MKDSQKLPIQISLWVLLSSQFGCGTETVGPQDQPFDDFVEWGNGIDDFSPSSTVSENQNSSESYQEDSGSSGVLYTDFSEQYCYGAEPTLVDCDPEIN